MNSNMKKAFGLLALLMAFGLLFACKKTKQTDPGTAKIRLVNTIPSSSGQYLYQENVKLFDNPVEYGLYSSYADVVASYSVFWTRDKHTELRTAITDAILYNNYKYTFFYYKTIDDQPMLAGFVNQDKTPASGKFRVRFLNISTAFEGKSLDVVDQNNDGISKGLAFGANPVYIELAVGTPIKVAIVDQGNYTNIPTSSFVEGKNYFVWFDTYDGDKVEYHIVEEN